MNHNIIIVKITSVQTLERCAAIYPSAYNTEPWNDNWTYTTALALLTCYYNTPEFRGWVALQDGKIIGCAIGNIEPYYSGDIFILKEVFVAAEAQNLGVGRDLLATMKENLETINIKMIILSTRTPIIDFYSKSGFKVMDDVSTMVYAY
ncbi:GNAT family N-acetyltransferase [Mucilaginibacter sp. UYCu711]|uniref:GNAT family N-acetyltransferase n=1 Tax=Mucilaginibacter sp. UYCu711 TaxID=3156339 RepID=UPI003D22792B